MGRKNVLHIYLTDTQAIPFNSPTNPDTSVSLASDFNTLATGTINLDNISYQINITTSDSQGSFIMQASEDGINWVDVGTAASVNAANDVAMVWVNSELCSAYIRLHYHSTTPGTGTCEIILTAKDIAA